MYSLEKLYERYPVIQEKVERPNDPALILNSQETVFLNLAYFFKNQKDYQITVNMLLEHLKDQELLFALELLVMFFQKDTTLIKEVNQSFYSSSLLKDQLVSATGFAKMVASEIEGSKVRPTTIHTYWHRRSKKIPRPDLIIEDVPYWKVEAVSKYIEKEKNNK